MKHSLFKRILSLLLAFTLCFSLFDYLGFKSYAVEYINVSGDGDTIVDSITVNGKTTYAKYKKFYGNGYNSDRDYCCAGFVRIFYENTYGVTVSNMGNYTNTPVASKGSFYAVSTPKVGDIARRGSKVHWAIVKEVQGNTVTFIEQNYWSEPYTSAPRNRTITANAQGNYVDSKGRTYTFFRYSEAANQSSAIQSLIVDKNYPKNFYATPKNIGKTDVYYVNYSKVNGRHIDYGDQCTILEVYVNEFQGSKFCKVSYPTSKGTEDRYYAKLSDFNYDISDYVVNQDGITKAGITAKNIVYPKWIYPGSYYEAYCCAITSNYPLISATVSITSKDTDTKIVKTWKENDDLTTKAVTFMELPINPEEFAALKEGNYTFKISASCKKLWVTKEKVIFEAPITVSKTKPSNGVHGIQNNYLSGNVQVIYAEEELNNSSNNNYYNGVSSFPIGTYKVKVNTSLNVRKGPGTSYAKVSSYKNGATVDVTATNGNWGYTGIGWICLDYATFVSYAETTYDSGVSYGTGNYVVTTAAGLNCRVGVGSNSTLIKTLPHGTQFSVIQTDGAWGYSPEHGGWLCLQYANYVSALTPSLPIPALPKLSTTTQSEFGVGEVISFKWDAVDTAELYNVKLVDANTNKTVQQTTITGTNASFKTTYAGKFNVSVSASNSEHTGPEATLYGFTAKAPSTVTFKDWDGKVISTQQVDYGKDATAPTAPSRVGHTFTKWDGKYTEVRENQVVTATYTKNKYKVTFCDYDGTVISTQDVYYGDAATAPKYSAPTGYSFVKWDTSFNNITKATTVKAVISWTSLYPLEISTSSAVQRNNKSYIVTSIVNNSPNAVNNARIIAVLKTKENKLLATVQSENISLAKGEVKNLTLTASYEGMATKAEIFVVKADNENIPLAKQLTKDVDQGTAWSSWSTSKPPVDALQVESRTEYRYRDKEFKTSTSSTLSGYTLRTDVTNPSVSYGSWGSWSAWQDSSVSSSDVREVKTQTVTDYTKFTAWGSWSAWQDSWVGGTDLREVQTQEVVSGYNTTHWWHYYRYANSSGSAGSSVQSSTYNNYQQIDLTYALTNHNGTVSNGNTGYRVYYNNANYNTVSGSYKTYWYLSETDEPNYNSPIYKTQYRYRDRSYGTKTQYSYRTRTKTSTYYFWKWGNWSSWNTTAVSGTSNRSVETRTTYRYLANTANNIETTAGKFVEPVTGYVDKSYVNRQALLVVTDKNDAIQFVGQTAIDSNGYYEFDFKTKDEVSVSTGDYKVMLSIEGTSAAFELEPIKAPVPEYTIKFVDYDGTVVSEQIVKQGEDASVPAPLSREGYRFIGWDKSYTNIQGNATINAQYEIKSFDVVFVDEINDTSVVERYNYGDTLVVPEVTLNDAYNFLGWDAVIDGNTKVTENMVVTAKFEKKIFTVDFLDFDGSLLESQTVEYGEPAIIPELENRDNYVFISWNIPGDTTYVTESMTIEPYYEYTETVATPTANIETGTYSGVQTVTLSCETEGAQIYYTTDGSDPLEEIATYARARSVQLNGTLYTGPFELDSTSQLLFTAVKDGMNASDYDYKTLAINTTDTENKQYTVTIHYGIYDAENTILVNDGELVVLDEELENYGYTLEGIYTDAEYKNAWNLETDTVKGETDLYLKWSKNNYTVTFKDMNDNVIDTQTVAFGDDAVAPVWNEVDGYIFTGWDTDYTNVIEDITVTATYVSVDNVTSVEFDKETLAIVEGQSETIKATVKLGTDCENDALIWQSSDEDVVIVDDNGKITAVAVGTATIFAISEDSGMSAQCEVTVDYKDPCAALGHKHEGKVTAPTCTEKGYTTYTCSVCGDTYTANEKASLGHNLSEVIPVLAPSCENAGHSIIKCSRCEYSEVEQIEATGHCDNDKNNICDDCGKELSASSKCSCNCHKTGFMSFIWKILRFFYKLFGINKVCGCGVAHY